MIFPSELLNVVNMYFSFLRFEMGIQHFAPLGGVYSRGNNITSALKLITLYSVYHTWNTYLTINSFVTL